MGGGGGGYDLRGFWGWGGWDSGIMGIFIFFF